MSLLILFKGVTKQYCFIPVDTVHFHVIHGRVKEYQMVMYHRTAVVYNLVVVVQVVRLNKWESLLLGNSQRGNSITSSLAKLLSI